MKHQSQLNPVIVPPQWLVEYHCITNGSTMSVQDLIGLSSAYERYKRGVKYFPLLRHAVHPMFRCNAPNVEDVKHYQLFADYIKIWSKQHRKRHDRPLVAIDTGAGIGLATFVLVHHKVWVVVFLSFVVGLKAHFNLHFFFICRSLMSQRWIPTRSLSRASKKTPNG
jgi:hypothetical protein